MYHNYNFYFICAQITWMRESSILWKRLFITKLTLIAYANKASSSQYKQSDTSKGKFYHSRVQIEKFWLKQIKEFLHHFGDIIGGQKAAYMFHGVASDLMGILEFSIQSNTQLWTVKIFPCNHHPFLVVPGKIIQVREWHSME